MAQRSDTIRPRRPKTVHQVAEELGVYPVEAFEFLHRALHFSVVRVHGDISRRAKETRHVSGRELCQGVRTYALQQYGMMARTVLARWNITSTFDIGRMVFALVDGGLLQKTPQDNLEDFRNVYDFSELDRDYCFSAKL